jgi:serine/threonine-protein kinase
MAPEQLTFGNVDRRADIFAASIVLWEALTGERLFAGDDQGSLIARVLTEPIERPSKYDPALPAALDAIVLRGLARTRIERFATAHEMALALEAAIVPARASAVGSWVADVAAESLSVRGSRLGEIESSHVPSVGPVDHPETGAPLARAESGETAATVHVGGEAPVGAKRRFAVRGTWAALAALFVLGAFFALTVRIVRGRARASSAPEVVAPSAPPMADAPVAAAAASNTDLDATNPPALAGTAARPASDPRRPAVKKARTSCSPPYSFDADGVKHFKPGCL